MRVSPFALVALVAANLVPLAGMAFLDWRLYDVMLLYWLENGVIGLYTLAKMATAGKAPASTLAVGPFFVVHYGMFWLVHGAFVVELFGGGGSFATQGAAASAAIAPSTPSLGLPMIGTVPIVPGLWIAIVGLLLSHGVSFVQNWLIGGERDGASPKQVMHRPYGRVVVLHLTVIAGGFAVQALGTPAAALVLMVLLKIGIDATAHLREHRHARATTGRREDAGGADHDVQGHATPAATGGPARR